MSRERIVTVSLALACFVVPLAAQELPPQYLIETRIIAIPADEGRECLVVSGNTEYRLRENGGGTAVFGEIERLVCGEMTVTLGTDGTVLWNGEEDPPEEGPLELISAPRVATQAGNKAAMMSGSALQYFMPGENGCYTLHNTAEENCPYDSPQLLLAFTPYEAEDDSGSPAVELDMELTLRSLERREQLHGVGLDVGPPVIGVRSVASKIRLALDCWNLVSGLLAVDAESGDGDFLLLLLRVRDARKLDLPQSPPTSRKVFKDHP